MSAFRRINADTLRTEAWANGAGTTTVLASGPDPQAWRWRLSIANLERDADFSALPGVRRQFAALDAPLTLHFPHRHEQPLLRLAVIRFDGGEPPHARLTEGPTRAFNLMLRDDAEGELIARPLNGAMLLPPAAKAFWFLHMLAGQARLQADDERLALSQGESTWVEARGRLRIEGGGEIVLVRLEL
jgi:hypothetical protein